MYSAVAKMLEIRRRSEVDDDGGLNDIRQMLVY